MGDKQLPFSALRALEAATRHESYTCAAKELDVTHSAVSQSIRRLEDELGAKLFMRRGGAMRPSPAALQLAQAYSEAAESLARSLQQIAQARAPDLLVLGASSDLARLWIAPRLDQLEGLFPDVVVELRTRTAPDRASDGALDMFVGLSAAAPPDSDAEILQQVRVFPVCSPAFAERFDISKPSDLQAASLLVDPTNSWSDWLETAGVALRPAARRRRFEDAATALEAAAGGLGVALTNALAAESLLTSGRLVAPVPVSAPGGALCMVRRPGDQGRQLLDELSAWFAAEAKLTIRQLGDKIPH